MRDILRGVTLLSLLLTPVVTAQITPPDLTMAGQISNPSPHHGETVRLDLNLKNAGPGTVLDGWIHLTLTNAVFLKAAAGSEQCRPASLRGDKISCTFSNLEAGKELNRSMDLRVGNSGSSMSVLGELDSFIFSTSSVSSEPPYASFGISLPVVQAAEESDIAIRFGHAPEALPLDTPATLNTTISNFGPVDVTDIDLVLEIPFGPNMPPDLKGAACEDTDYWGRVKCTIPFLASGSQVVIEYSMPAQSTPKNWRRQAVVTFPDTTDPNGDDNDVVERLMVGGGQVATVLIPLAIQATDGAFGSRWISELSVFIDAEDDTFFYPTYEICRILCPGPPTALTYIEPGFRQTPALWVVPTHPGYLLHYDARKADRISFAHRIRDLSRELDTWGTEVPVVSEDEFLTGRTQLIDIAAGPRFRQTLRIYGLDGQSRFVTVRLHGETGVAGGARSPHQEHVIGETVVRLAPFSDLPTDDPIHASYAQVDLLSAFPAIDGFDRLRVEIEPAPGDEAYWAFVSITNNDTQHVTLVTPQ